LKSPFVGIKSFRSLYISLKKGDFDSVSPLLRGVRGDLKVPKVTAKNFSNTLLETTR
jgi:hypothetical protein